MTPDNTARRKLLKTFERARAKHKVLLAKVGKTRAKLAKRTRKLQALEAKIAILERRSAQASKGKPGQTAAKNGHLRQARLIANPESGGGSIDNSKRLVQIVSCLRRHGILAGIELKSSGKAARQMAQEAVKDGVELVIVAGGDGTIEDVASQLIHTETTLGIIPIGTSNNLARSLGIPLRIEEACQLIGMGVTRQVDLGRLVTSEKPSAEYFMELAGIGLSAIVIPTGQAVEKKRWGVLPSALRKLFDAQPEPIRVEFDDGQVIQAYSQIITVSNAPLMGRNLLIAPDAKMDDGQLDIAIYDHMGKTELLRYFSATGNGSRPQDPKVRFYRSKSVRIHAEQAVQANADKEVLSAKREFEIQTVPSAITVIAGKGIGLSLPVEAVSSVPPLSGTQSETTDEKSAEKADLQKQTIEKV